MLYLIFNTLENAKLRTENIARNMGCGGNSDDQTIMWFGLLEHPIDTSIGALFIPKLDISLLTEEEVNSLKTYDEMVNLGWFSET